MSFDVPTITHEFSAVFTKHCSFPLLVTHYAHPAMLAEAERRKVLVAQSFEW